MPVAGIGLAALLGVVAYLATLSWPLLFPAPVFSGQTAADCDLGRGPCVATFDDRRFIRLQLGPRPLSPSGPLRAVVDSAGFTARSAFIEFNGVDMDMGLIRNALLGTGGGSFTGDLVLPVCIRQRMRWRAVVTVHARDGVYRASFDFEIRRR